MTSGILWAAGDLGGLVTLVFLVIWLIGTLLSKLGKGTQAQAVRRPEAARVQDQIEEFLRRASARQGEAAAPPGQAAGKTPAVTAEVVDDDVVGGRVTRQVKTYMDTSDFTRRSNQMGEEVVQSDEQFTKHVDQAFVDDVSTLARRPGETAAAPQAGTRETDEDTAIAEEPEDTAFTGLLDLFGSPNTIVQAIIMSEIIRRPEESSALERPKLEA